MVGWAEEVLDLGDEGVLVTREEPVIMKALEVGEGRQERRWEWTEEGPYWSRWSWVGVQRPDRGEDFDIVDERREDFVTVKAVALFN